MMNLLSRKHWLAQQTVGRHLLLLLDYDGTLAPIRKTPDKATLPSSTKTVLLRLAETSGVTLAIVSGRDFTNLKKKTGLNGIVLSSSHGLRIDGAGLKYKAIIPKMAQTSLTACRKEFTANIAVIPGAFIERKEFSFALHYRLTPSPYLGKIRKLCENVLPPYFRKGLCAKTGKKVIEVMPDIPQNKGTAALKILGMIKKNHKKLCTIYIGDDMTDETAFIALSRKGITCLVGNKRKTAAEYNLKNPTQVRQLLNFLLKNR